MQKLCLALCCFLFLGLQMASAQGDREKNLRFGVHLSPTFSRLKSSDKFIETGGTNLGVKLQMVGEKFFTKNYAFSTGIGFSFNQGGTLQNGHDKGVFWPKSDLSNINLDTLSKDAKLHYRLTYVEVPVSLKLVGGSGTDNPLRYYVEPSVFLSFMTKAKGDIRGTNTQNVEDEDIRSDVVGLGLSWGFGAGIEYELAESLTIFTGLGYQKSFSDLTDDSGSVLPVSATSWRKENSKTTNGMITLKIGVFF
jgi:hypothetical protein